MKRAALSSILRDTRAAAAAEMALALPMLFALMFTMFEAGNYFLAEHQVLKGVREGARYAARLDLSNFDCSSTSIADSTIEDNIQNVTVAGRITGGTIRVQGWDVDDVTVSVSCGADSGTTYKTGLYKDITQSAAPKVQVSTVLDYQPLMGLLGFGFPAKLRAQSQAAVMGL